MNRAYFRQGLFFFLVIRALLTIIAFSRFLSEKHEGVWKKYDYKGRRGEFSGFCSGFPGGRDFVFFFIKKSGYPGVHARGPIWLTVGWNLHILLYSGDGMVIQRCQAYPGGWIVLRDNEHR